MSTARLALLFCVYGSFLNPQAYAIDHQKESPYDLFRGYEECLDLASKLRKSCIARFVEKNVKLVNQLRSVTLSFSKLVGYNNFAFSYAGEEEAFFSMGAGKDSSPDEVVVKLSLFPGKYEVWGGFRGPSQEAEFEVTDKEDQNFNF